MFLVMFDSWNSAQCRILYIYVSPRNTLRIQLLTHITWHISSFVQRTGIPVYVVLIVVRIARSGERVAGDAAGGRFAVQRRLLERLQLHLIVMDPQVGRFDVRFLIRVLHVSETCITIILEREEEKLKAKKTNLTLSYDPVNLDCVCSTPRPPPTHRWWWQPWDRLWCKSAGWRYPGRLEEEATTCKCRVCARKKKWYSREKNIIPFLIETSTYFLHTWKLVSRTTKEDQIVDRVSRCNETCLKRDRRSKKKKKKQRNREHERWCLTSTMQLIIDIHAIA